MNDTSANNNIIENEVPSKVCFCRKCGSKLSEGSLVCAECNTVVEEYTDNLISDFDVVLSVGDTSKQSTKHPRKRKKIVICSVVSVVLISIIILVGIFLSKIIIKPQDIDIINGCPEFYDLQWGMSDFDVDETIELKHTMLPASRNFDSSTYKLSYTSDASLLIDGEETFYVYGKKTDGVHIYFDGNALDSVIITFSKEKYTLDEIVKMYKKIYGEPDEEDKLFSSWYGFKTTINVFDFEAISENGDKTIAVRYLPTENSKYTAISFNGEELDPCSFLSSNYAFDKVPDFYIEGLQKGEDYDVEEYNPEGFSGHTQYTLYPSFEYMGIEPGMTAIELNMDENEDNIGLVSYKFLLDETNAVDRVKYIHSKLNEKYGEPTNIGYTSTYYSKMGIKDLTYDEVINQISNNTEGLYHIQWKLSERTITLGLGIIVNKEYYEGSVSYSN